MALPGAPDGPPGRARAMLRKVERVTSSPMARALENPFQLDLRQVADALGFDGTIALELEPGKQVFQSRGPRL